MVIKSKGKSLIFFISLCLFLNCANINLNSISTLSQDILFQNPYVQITISAQINSVNQKKQVEDFNQFTLKSVDKVKRKAYLKLVNSYEKLVNLLKKQIIIGDQSLLIKSKIKQKYLKNKRLWQFSILFIIKQSSAFQKQNSRQLAKLGVIKINSRQKSFIFNSKILAINTFFQAKQRLERELSKYKKYCIESVKNIQVSDFDLDNTELINLSYSDQDTSQSSQNQKSQYEQYNNYFFYQEQCKYKKNKPKITVIFKIKKNCERFQDSSSNYIEIDSSDSQYRESQTDQNSSGSSSQ